MDTAKFLIDAYLNKFGFDNLKLQKLRHKDCESQTVFFHWIDILDHLKKIIFNKIIRVK